jgi:hypothetical protein
VKLADVAQMWSMITGFWVSQLVGAAARLSLADHLASGPAHAESSPCVRRPIPARWLGCSGHALRWAW